METHEMKDILLRTVGDVSQIRKDLLLLTEKDSLLTKKEEKVKRAIDDLKARLKSSLASFDRDHYKSTEKRLELRSLAHELDIFNKLGYDLSMHGVEFFLGVNALLDGRNQAAQAHFRAFIDSGENKEGKSLWNAHYLSAMICYNRNDQFGAKPHFEAAFDCSPEGHRDWQSKIYIAELLYFLRESPDAIEHEFTDTLEQILEEEKHFDIKRTKKYASLKATLLLKHGNCFFGGFFLPPQRESGSINLPLALRKYKSAKSVCPIDEQSLLPVIIDYSIAQALYLQKVNDFDLPPPSDLFADVFNRLRRIILNKREEIILAQSYFMMATCAYHSNLLSNDLGEIYLEYARHETLTVPPDIHFYSCVTKEMLTREDFIKQIDFYVREFNAVKERN